MKQQIRYLPSISDLIFDIVPNKGTWLKGRYMAQGTIPSIIYPLAEKNVFILGHPTAGKGASLRMVKIRVTEKTTFDWLDGRNVILDSNKDEMIDDNEECGKQSTFHEGCFKGSFQGQDKYNVDLVATVVESKGITQAKILKSDHRLKNDRLAV